MGLGGGGGGAQGAERRRHRVAAPAATGWPALFRPARVRGRLLVLGHEAREEVGDLLADVAHRVVIGLVSEGGAGRDGLVVSCVHLGAGEWGRAGGS